MSQVLAVMSFFALIGFIAGAIVYIAVNSPWAGGLLILALLIPTAIKWTPNTKT